MDFIKKYVRGKIHSVKSSEERRNDNNSKPNATGMSPNEWQGRGLVFLVLLRVNWPHLIRLAHGSHAKKISKLTKIFSKPPQRTTQPTPTQWR
jgi:hypothetical protein